MNSYISPVLLIVIVFSAIVVIFLSIFIPASINNNRYRKFVKEHSKAYKTLLEINKKYKFKTVPNFDMKHSYDNENFYDDISCEDYLTYQLVFKQKQVKQAMFDAALNDEYFKTYKTEIKQKCFMDQYDTDELLRNRNKLIKTESKEFDKTKLNPVTSFSILVKLVLTNINGRYKKSKYDVFSFDQIKRIIHHLNQKRGSYYANENIWKSICRVERGKVTNKMRFAIYERDHWRCCKCHRKTNDLEADHIYPIAKGGKSTFDNLQTLCHRCNVKKGANLDF